MAVFGTFWSRFGGFVIVFWARAGKTESGGGEFEGLKMEGRKMGWGLFSAVRDDSGRSRRRGRRGGRSRPSNAASGFVFREEAIMIGVAEASGDGIGIGSGAEGREAGPADDADHGRGHNCIYHIEYNTPEGLRAQGKRCTCFWIYNSMKTGTRENIQQLRRILGLTRGNLRR